MVTKVQLGSNWTHVHVAMLVVTICTCGLFLPIWTIVAIVHIMLILSNRGK